MTDCELTFNKLELMGRFQIISFLHVVYSREFDHLSLVEITYIMNTHQELDEILEVSSAVMLCFQVGSSWRHIKKYWLILEKFELENRMSFSLRLVELQCVGVISNNEELKTNVGFFLMTCFQIIFIFMLMRNVRVKNTLRK